MEIELGGEGGSEEAAEAVEAAAEAVEAAAEATEAAAEAAGEAAEAAAEVGATEGEGSGDVALHERMAVLETTYGAHAADGNIHLSEEFVRSIARSEAYAVSSEVASEAAAQAAAEVAAVVDETTVTGAEEVTVVTPDVGEETRAPRRGILSRIW